MDFKLNNGGGKLCCRGCSRQNNKLNTYDWLADVPGNDQECDMVEVQFKNTRKGYYRNSNKIELVKGDIVAVEATPGHDIGVVTLTGRLVPLQMKKANLKPDAEIKRIYRKAKPVDMEKYEEAKAKEHATMIRSRQIAASLNLDMKIGDVEYQGDGNKAIFYYIADERVDFRQLIKVLAEAFRVRIEMKQIGARQEAGRIGGIGPCGRELCCATWMTSFVSVSTSAARYQDISLNPQKLAGQCAKLKCCLNYEIDCYVEAQKRLPSKEVELETKDGTFYYFKADILTNQITYSTDKTIAANLTTISGRRAFEIIGLNKRGIKPDTLLPDEHRQAAPKSADLLEQDSLTRFDRRKKKGGKGGANADENGGGKNRRKKKGGNGNNAGNNAENKGEGGQQQGNQPKDGQQQGQQQPKQKGNQQPRQPKQQRQPKGEHANGGEQQGQQNGNQQQGNQQQRREKRNNRQRNNNNGGNNGGNANNNSDNNAGNNGGNAGNGGNNNGSNGGNAGSNGGNRENRQKNNERRAEKPKANNEETAKE
jgi:cell fate regulator YaaT (PSP1 superfamily)